MSPRDWIHRGVAKSRLRVSCVALVRKCGRRDRRSPDRCQGPSIERFRARQVAFGPSAARAGLSTLALAVFFGMVKAEFVFSRIASARR